MNRPHPGKWKLGDKARVSDKAPEANLIMFGNDIGEVVDVSPLGLVVLFRDIRLVGYRNDFRKVTDL